MIANHAEKALYIVPVPLDTASIGDATICSPVVFKRERGSLICSILPTPTTDLGKMCSGSSLRSTSFSEAIRRAEWTISSPHNAPISHPAASNLDTNLKTSSASEDISSNSSKLNLVFVTETTILPPFIASNTTQIIRYGTGLEFLAEAKKHFPECSPSAVILPCIFGTRLEGPLLLATGKAPENVPFHDGQSLRTYYEQFKTAIVFVDERMTDNARNLATPWRINAVFVVQMALNALPKDGDVKVLLNLVNINAVTALAGPQSLILVHISGKYYFYRGIANRNHLNTSTLAFGSDITNIVDFTDLEALLDPRVKRIVNLDKANEVLLPNIGKDNQGAKASSFGQFLELRRLDMHTLETLRSQESKAYCIIMHETLF